MPAVVTSITLGILGGGTIAKNLAERRSWPKPQPGHIEPLDKLPRLIEQGDIHFYRNGNGERGIFMQGSLSVARPLRAWGA
jgi:hypothetical protein